MLDILQHHKLRFVPVSSYGRSGGSFFMGLLRACGVAVRGDLPFEDRAVQVAFIRWLGQGFGAGPRANLKYAYHFATRYDSPLFEGARDEDECLARLTAFCAEVGPNGIIAEKTIGNQLLALMRAYDGSDLIKPIYLVRDPRDIFLSIKAFNARRQTTGFGDTGDDDRLFKSICGFCLNQLHFHRRDGGLILFYEDLMTDRPQSLVQLFHYLGRDPVHAGDITAALARARHSDAAVLAHRTKTAETDSIGRWRTAEGAPYQAVFAARIANINAIGYPAG
jgi:hypothetical protein